ncbi:HpcH/HpaI aldolase family protein [Arthrobacter sp. HY1533]|uniref:HpcH/HpaI aldolase family protein n=1 Tax=Arthrobacter sp. HY1533 TaxID=2970919 RepID=UPI0022B9D582|nr:HpcH/HpaI aldolase/citrate lyase family protein [Arthrobacter sp. HY1533]
MPFPVTPDPSLKDALAAAGRPLVGMWVNSGSALVAEICAGSGLDAVVIDGEHGPNGLPGILAQLQAVRGHPVTAVVRPPVNDTVVIKQYLDIGVQSLLIPMVHTAAEAAAAVAATRYPPEGVRGVGSALARSSRWNRFPDYAGQASSTITVMVQLESAQAVDNVAGILAVDGVDGVFLGPADLAASMGWLGQQEHPEVLAAVEHCIAAAKAAGKPVGVNAFAPATARHYLDAGVDFILVGADVTLLARGSEGLAAAYIPQ